MRIRLVVNPSASSTTPRARRGIAAALGRVHDLDVVETAGRDEATELGRRAATDGVDVVAVLGGDGTLNEVANGLVGSRTALAPLPGGSTNVFARSIGLSRSPERAVEQVLDALERVSLHRIGVGSANGRRFLVNLGAGFDAAVIARVEATAVRRPWIKRRLAHASIAVTATATFLRGYDRRNAAYRIATPDGDVGDGYYAVVSNATPYAYFGPRPLTVSRHAGLDRTLALTTFRRLDLPVLVPATLAAMRDGAGMHGRREVVQRADLGELTITATGPGFPWQVDGEYLGLVDRLTIRHEPDALSVVLP